MSTYPSTIQIPVINKPLQAKVSIPGSKSITNRALLLAMLAKGCSQISNYLDSVDTKVVLNTYTKLGVCFENKGTQLIVYGKDGSLPACNSTLNIENAGTAARFLAGLLVLGKGQYTIDGNERMRQRPLQDLITALQQVGVDIKSVYNNGCPPIKIIAGSFLGGQINIKGNNSSQYTSAIMLAAPFAKNMVTINLQDNLVSRPYVEMTAIMMREFGAKVDFLGSNKIVISNEHNYLATNYIVESDYSSASYFLALAAICKGQVTIENLNFPSIQGDQEIINILQKMGCHTFWNKQGLTISCYEELRPLGEIDLYHYSDLLPTVAVLAVFAGGVTHIKNVKNVRIKESDRIAALVKELSKLGLEVVEYDDGLKINGLGNNAHNLNRAVVLDSYDDHRLAMSLSLLGLKINNIIIDNPQTVSKTFPTFFKTLFQAISYPASF